ncbi:tRNA (cytosine(32)/uridine(32)-2'-O)-methyltransferase TrmJ [Halopseudomonas salegens]|uniref:tRNA (cytidine/uridine-2'-O-)-methyltransferase TrmJ n=1 Tax=Halopseudomonas salegens TaxID=1434072 RepID=A0A1H2GVL7_9GAMM|nr:tRNA (cytosine(32)/uridine(32)-2'-O)-methyltransferase TrmJ [Halopseudomonas salegens]SDU23664.1 tRNA/rRNA methyltransferase/tRNA (cytidine32/uridine32-2'-O)-methyltransferase [Halopseudomonas salegens]
MLERIRVVLVNTSHPGNIGAAARAMKNMGLQRLVLVEPRRFPDADASARASGADDVLQHAQVVGSLQEAIADCQLVLGTSARDRRIPWPVLDPREAAQTSLEHLRDMPQGDVALVFGREDSGLTSEELQRCQYHIHIPSDPAFSSLNLAAAVQVVSYELRMLWLQWAQQPTKLEKATVTAREHDLPVSVADMENYFQHLEQVLVEIGFHNPQKPRQLMPRLRRLYSRSGLNRMEMNILRGILTETQKAIGVKPAGARRD